MTAIRSRPTVTTDVSDEGHLPVVLSWTGDGTVWEGRVLPDDAPAWMRATGEHAVWLQAALEVAAGTPVGGRLYECEPGDQALLDRAAKRFGDSSGFMRAFAHDDKHRISVNARYREVKPPVAVNSVAVVAAMQNAQIQHQLAAIEQHLRDVNWKLDQVLRNHLIDLHARVRADVTLVEEVWGRLQERGKISLTDWERISGCEQSLFTAHTQIMTKLRQAANALRFVDHDGAQAAQDLDEVYLRQLWTLHEHVCAATGWHHVIAHNVRVARGEAGDADGEAAMTVLAQLKREGAAERDGLVKTAPPVKYLPMWQAAVTIGMIQGHRQNIALDRQRERSARVRSSLTPTAGEVAGHSMLTLTVEGREVTLTPKYAFGEA